MNGICLFLKSRFANKSLIRMVLCPGVILCFYSILAFADVFIPAKAEYITGKPHEFQFSEFQEFTIQLPARKGKKVIHARDFGADPGKENNFQAFSDAIQACRETGATHLVIEAGTYYIDTNESLDFSNLSDLIVEGNGAEFTFYISKEYVCGIVIRHCSRILFQDLIIDWDWKRAPIACTAEIIDANSTTRSFDLDMDIKHPEGRGIRSMEPFNPHTREIGSEDHIEKGHWNFEKQEWIDTHTLRIWTYKGHPVTAQKDIGTTYRARYYDYQNTAICYSHSQHITFKGIRIYSFAGSAFYGAQDCNYIHFTNCKITKRPGTDRVISSAADQCMMRNAKGFIKIENCDFGYGGDDPINIHPGNHMGLTKISDNEIQLSSYRLGWWSPFEANDIVEFRHNDLSPTGFITTIKTAEYSDYKRKCRLTLSDNLPSYVREDSFIFDQRWATRNYIIRNCRFHHNRARGILAQSSNGIIENCIFEDLQGPAIQIETGWMELWSEGYGVQNLIIRNNTFTNCNLGRWKLAYGAPVIYIGTYLPHTRPAYKILEGLVIEMNDFRDVGDALISLHSAKKVIIRSNNFHNTRPSQYSMSTSGSILLRSSSDVCIDQNKWHQWEHTHWSFPGLIVESDSVNDIRFTENSFFSM